MSLPLHSPSASFRASFLRDLGHHLLLPDELFDALPDVVFFIKDQAGRYVTIGKSDPRRSLRWRTEGKAHW